MGDLQKLGMNHPEALCRDTMRYPVFQRRGGTALPLKTLARDLLGRTIQVGLLPLTAAMCKLVCCIPT
jgi:hypothetical protein